MGRAYGLVGYDTAFTRRRSPVRIRLGPYGGAVAPLITSRLFLSEISFISVRE